MQKIMLAALWSLAAVTVAGADPDPNQWMTPAAARAAVGPSLRDMGDAANAHDVERHVGFYAHTPTVILIADGQEIVGWDAIHDKQREWWQGGKTDVVYTMVGRPDYLVPGPDLVMTTLLVKAHRTAPDGKVKEGEFAVSALWQKRPEGWRVIYSHESSSR